MHSLKDYSQENLIKPIEKEKNLLRRLKKPFFFLSLKDKKVYFIPFKLIFLQDIINNRCLTIFKLEIIHETRLSFIQAKLFFLKSLILVSKC